MLFLACVGPDRESWFIALLKIQGTKKIAFYNPTSNTYAIYKKNGMPITLYKPDLKNIHSLVIWSIFLNDKIHGKNHSCRICGLFSSYPYWDEEDESTDTICGCCGAQSGYEDLSLDCVKRYREQWLNEGAKVVEA